MVKPDIGRLKGTPKKV